MKGQELLDAIGQMNSEELAAFCQHDAEHGGDECAALELENLLFDAIETKLGYSVREAEDSPEAAVIVRLVEAMDIPTSWSAIMAMENADEERDEADNDA